MVPERYSNVKAAAVILRRHVIVGSGSIILPGVTLEEGTAIGALSLVRKSTEPWTVYAGIPATKNINAEESKSKSGDGTVGHIVTRSGR